METFLLYKHFKTCPEIKTPNQEQADFWMGILLASCQPFVSTECCPVRSPWALGAAGSVRRVGSVR